MLLYTVAQRNRLTEIHTLQHDCGLYGALLRSRCCGRGESQLHHRAFVLPYHVVHEMIVTPPPV